MRLTLGTFALMVLMVATSCGKSDDGSSSTAGPDNSADQKTLTGFWYGGSEISSDNVTRGRFLKIENNLIELKAKCMYTEPLEAVASAATQVSDNSIEVSRTASTDLNINGRRCAATLKQGPLEYRLTNDGLFIKRTTDTKYRKYEKITQEEYQSKSLPAQA